ncbi:hypothetical protein VPH35_039330 [Triticum aestivum]|uniref:uncharacterized protein n=1 Tax=Triticum aestivum TaxID=4565 RepID=UPI0008439D04|nr:uncharacterized protein LOC123049846 [Triticum aestivum]
MTNGRVRRAGGEIADDILRDVFQRLPGYQHLLRCAATCKRWRGLVTDRAFLRRIALWPQTARGPSILAGIFYQITCPVGKPRPKHGQPPEFLNLQLGGAHATFSSFVHGAHLTFGSLVDNDDGLFAYARPLASRRGLLLVSILLPTMFDGMGGTARDKLLLAVCRPVVDKQRSLLPLLSFDLSGSLDWHLTGCALLTDEDHGVIDYLDQRRERSSSFQVFLTCTGDNGIIYVYMYSSATDTWSTPTKFCQASHLIRCGPFAGVVTRNTVHWLYKDETSFYTLDVKAITTDVSLTKIPIHVEACRQWGRVLFPCVSGEGNLSFVSMRNHGILVLWTKQEQDDDGYGREASSRGWLGADLINLGSKDEINNVFYAERRGAMLIERCGGSFFTIDLKSKEKAYIDIKARKRGVIQEIS